MELINQIKTLILNQDVRVSDHGYDELSNDDLSAREVISGVAEAILVEEYPNFPKGASVLFLQEDRNGNPIHVVWGIPKDYDRPAVLITAYRPDPHRWDAAFMIRNKS